MRNRIVWLVRSEVGADSVLFDSCSELFRFVAVSMATFFEEIDVKYPWKRCAELVITDFSPFLIQNSEE